MYRQAIIIINILLIAASAFAGNSNGPTDYTFDECRGSANPYPAPESRMALPDTLSVIMINHLGRHGARYETSPKRANKIRDTLMKAKKQNTLSAKGDSMLDIVNRTLELSKDKWGALDSLGMKEQQGIAARIYRTWPALVKNSHIEAISSYIPRCIMSMYEFTHKLSSIDDNVEILTSSGKVNSPLMRPFAIDSAYLDIRKDAPWAEALDSFYKKNIPLEPVWRLVGHDTMNRDDARQFAISLFGFLCGLNASGIDGDFLAEFYTIEEANKMWECRNITQYLERTTSVYSSIPSDITRALLADFINTTDYFLSGRSKASLNLRFGHAETVMPFLSLIRLPGCYYVSKDLDSVSRYWKNFYVTPMATNLQMIICVAPSGTPYIRLDLNEHPVCFPGTDKYYVSWKQARKYFNDILDSATSVPAGQ